MKIVETIAEVREAVSAWKKEGKSVGVVPTMGYLHDGHCSLIRRSVEENDRTIVTIFVNPTQFGAGEDLSRYPRDLERDSGLCEQYGADLIFHPAPEEMYQDAHCYVDIDLLSEHLCGASRPGHFRGVCTVVSKLFNITQADRGYFGEKDAQQLAIIRKMAFDLNIPVEVIPCPTVREEDGLALSSRNSYLSPEERYAAKAMPAAGNAGKALLEERPDATSGEVKAAMQAVFDKEPMAKVDYIEVVDALNLQPVETIEGEVLVAYAAYFGKTRLIDNFLHTP